MPLGAVAFRMTIKAIARTCLGDVFDDNAEVEKLSSCYHTCWREMEASTRYVDWYSFFSSSNFIYMYHHHNYHCHNS